MSRSKSSKNNYSFGLGLSFIPLWVAVGLTNDKVWLGLFMGLLTASMIEFIRYRKLKSKRNAL